MSGQEIPLVAHIIYALGTGGLENGLVNIINRIPPDRYRHAIICLTSADAFSGRLTAPNVQIIELHKQPGNDPAVYWRLWRTLRNLRPDIVHTRNLAALETQILGVFMPGVKRVHGEHGRDIHDLDGSNRKYRLLRRALRPLIHRYVAVSQDLANWLAGPIAVRRGRICQIYNGVDQSVFRPRQASRPDVLPAGFLPGDDTAGEFCVLGTVGRLAEVKDQGTLLRAVALLLRDRPDWRDRLRLILVGDGPLKDQLLAQVQELGLSEVVWMPGDRNDIAALLQAMDLFVLPSLAEGISNTVLEAMATGLPVVATAVGGNPELVKEGVTGSLVPPKDSQALCAALLTLIESPETRSRMGRRALTRIQDHFNWDNTVASYLGIYDELLGRSSVESHRHGSSTPVKELGAG
jgi:sugar transferase (PEP-CTERM/EpsH1 system associated)